MSRSDEHAVGFGRRFYWAMGHASNVAEPLVGQCAATGASDRALNSLPLSGIVGGWNQGYDSGRSVRWRLVHQPQRLSPEDFLRFVETDEFRDDWEKLGFDIENDLWDLQDEIMSGPRGAPVIRGTGGLRKLRFARRQEQIGKRGGARVCYAYFEKHRTVLLVMAYGKERKGRFKCDGKTNDCGVPRAN